MQDMFFSSLFVALYAVGIAVAWVIVAFCTIVCLSFFKHLRYYYAIYKHPELFGDAKTIPWEVKKRIVARMQKTTERTLRALNPDNPNVFDMKIFHPEEADRA